jgi:hypothetical protein
MKLHILGCGDAFGSGGRNQSGYLVEAKTSYSCSTADRQLCCHLNARALIRAPLKQFS